MLFDSIIEKYAFGLCCVMSVNKFFNLKKRDRLPRLTSLPALLTVIKSRYAIPLRYAIKAAFGISETIPNLV